MQSKYSREAAVIHGKKEKVVPTSKDQAWKAVKTSDDIVEYYKTYYPEFPDQLAIALADYYTRAKMGEIELPESYLTKTETTHWDYEKDIAEEKLKAQMILTERRLQKLLDDDE